MQRLFIHPDYRKTMREIKFRGQCLDTRNWIEGDLLHCYGKDAGRVFIKTVAGLFEVDPATVGQYTGLKDKNGREIYEGNVVDRTRRTWCTSYLQSGDDYTDEVRRCVCVFVNGKFMLEDVKVNKRGLKPLFDLNIGDVAIEIIGNRFDTPELLK